MWHLEVSERDVCLFRLRLPAAGLRLGAADDCDVQLPGLETPVKIEPARKEIFLTRAGGAGEAIPAGEPVALGRYSLVASTAALPPAAASRTQWLRYDPARQTVTATTAALQIVAGPDAPREIDVDRESLVIGTSAGCDATLTDEFVSGRHVRLQRTRDGWAVVDLGSRNGVFLDEVRVQEAVWPAGAKLRLGKTTLLLARQNCEERAPLPDEEQFAGMVGRSPAMRRVFGLIRAVAPTEATVRLQGPTGSGKELAARAIHAASRRADGPFIAVNCGSVARDLIAGELFGHVKGAFTGAGADRAGLFELAGGGTIFLDEIGELPLELQPNLLRVLEDREVRRVGGNRAVPIDARVIAASNRDLPAETAAGRFREDLFYRLDAFPIQLPSLRERLEDLPLLVDHLLAREARGLRRSPPRLTHRALAALRAQAWPGNVRELANVLSRAMLLAGGRDALDAGDFALGPAAANRGGSATASGTLVEAEREAIRRALAECASVKDAATRLGVAVSTVYAKAKKYGFDLSHKESS